MTSGTICPRCESPDPKLHPAMQFEGEWNLCTHPFHEIHATPTPPPLQHGDEVWVRAVVQDIGYDHSMECVTADVILAGMKTANRVIASAIRRIEGEVKP